MNKQSKLTFFFDMDGVLLTSDSKKEAEHLYMNLDYVKPIEDMIKFFNEMRSKYDVYILTTRHPDLIPLITEYFEMDESHVICRDFGFSREYMKRVNSSKKETLKFLDRMILYKTCYLIDFMLQNPDRKVLFIDDAINKFNGEFLGKYVNQRTLFCFSEKHIDAIRFIVENLIHNRVIGEFGGHIY